MIGIYKITNSITNKSYIGQSIDIERRIEDHKFRNSNSLIHLIIQQYGWDNFTYEILEECSQQELNEKEIKWINFYNSFENGYNLNRGGSGFFYDINLIYKDYLQTNSIKQTAKNVGCHETTVRNIIHGFGINKIDLQENKPIEQIDIKTLQTIKIFDSINEAAEAMNVSHNAIKNAAQGRVKSSCGYYWRFSGDDKTFKQTNNTKQWKRKILQLNYNSNQVIAEFPSAAEAARSLNKDGKNGGSQITAVCSGRKKSAYGYKWSYVTE